MRGSDTCELIFENCEVPAENLLGEENKVLVRAVNFCCLDTFLYALYTTNAGCVCVDEWARPGAAGVSSRSSGPDAGSNGHGAPVCAATPAVWQEDWRVSGSVCLHALAANTWYTQPCIVYPHS